MKSRRRKHEPERIALVIHSMTPGGAERATATMANNWARRGHAVAVISLDSGEDEFYELNPAVERIALDVAGESAGRIAALSANLRRVSSLRRCLRRFAPDVVIGMMNTSALLCLAATAGMRCITIGAERTWPARSEDGGLWAKARRRGYAWLDAVVAQTDAASQWLRDHTRARHVITIPNALSWPIPSNRPVRAPDSVIAAERRLLLAVGRPEPVKGFDLLLSAFAVVADRHRQWDLVILGEGGSRSSLCHDAAALALSDRVHLPGQVGNVADWYERADLFVLSSRAEGFPNSLLEAMASGCAVVATRCNAGPADIVHDGEDGLLVAPDDSTALAAALDTLMGDDSLRERFARRAVQARERFAEDAILLRWEALFSRHTADTTPSIPTW